ncbi:OJ1116_C07.5 [Oryza sativa Japonica Group]|uniref:OJ1116_C07.5 protein n=1 Tax=Oryza sativa subsp. japonica TaxID=39947 RepID=Q7F0U0_ORYSJ|nr:OJ1116_C07.5 [Oryza sativa Japonica Group]
MSNYQMDVEQNLDIDITNRGWLADAHGGGLLLLLANAAGDVIPGSLPPGRGGGGVVVLGRGGGAPGGGADVAVEAGHVAVGEGGGHGGERVEGVAAEDGVGGGLAEFLQRDLAPSPLGHKPSPQPLHAAALLRAAALSHRIKSDSKPPKNLKRTVLETATREDEQDGDARWAITEPDDTI